MWEEENSSYGIFAEVYDIFMDDIPYDKWATWITDTLVSYHIDPPALVCDLGCGTGQMTGRLAKAGYDMIGIDASVEMLDVAREAAPAKDILYLCQDMRSFELYGTVGAIVSVCDSINYLLSEDALLETFRLAANYLDPQGIFIFDLKTPYFFRHILGGKTFVDQREDASIIWENSLDAKSGINSYLLTMFLADDDGRYERFTELHRQRGYEALKVAKLLEKAGLTIIDVRDEEFKVINWSKDAGGDISAERLWFTAQFRGTKKG